MTTSVTQMGQSFWVICARNAVVRCGRIWCGLAAGRALELRSNPEWCDDVKFGDGIFICVGTSALVQPAASLISLFSQVKHKFIVDIKPLEVVDYEVLKGPAREQLPILVERILKENNGGFR